MNANPTLLTSQVFEIKGEKLAELSQLVKRVGDQQKELVLDISQQLSRHNELMSQAVDKQSRMESKIASIEEALLQRADFGYKRKMEKIEKQKSAAMVGMQKKFTEDQAAQQHHRGGSRSRKSSHHSGGGSEDDGFRSCEEADKQ
ncbi:hypothetical protein FGO68_gene13120 [Halteria grandinella]|uniref:Uncharacterized protein n=1 Tax=Halteria grandinella TaxID=5974 RepID=A0A8J8SW09_HALGN|nr:hypothetical protein FGO68_gene13120 [Halteria grandinella]